MPAAKKVIPNPAAVKNFPHDNKKAKIIYDRVNDVLRVVERNYYWDPQADRGKEKRVYLGYIVDDVYYATADYRKYFKRNGVPRLVTKDTKKTKTKADEKMCDSLSSSLAAELPVYHAIAAKIGLIHDLRETFGKALADMTLSVAYHWLNTSANAAYLYKTWAPGKLLPSTTIPCSVM